MEEPLVNSEFPPQTVHLQPCGIHHHSRGIGPNIHVFSSTFALERVTRYQRRCWRAVVHVSFPVDILLSPTMDILDNSFYEPLLRICASGVVAYGAGAPNCGEYSRLKLRDGGPPALRTPEFLQGLPNLSPAQLSEVQSSFELMVRIVICLEIVYSAGGHVHLEQPTNSMAWLEKDVSRFIKFCAPHLVNFAACAYGANWSKSWLLACLYISMSSLGKTCNHPKNSHEVIAGQTEDGTFRSRKTAEYPELCSAIAKLISPLRQSESTTLDLATATALIPKKGLHDPSVMKMEADYHHNRTGAGPIDKRQIFSILSENHGWIAFLKRNCITNSCAFYMTTKHLLLFQKTTFNHFQICYHNSWRRTIGVFLGTFERTNHCICQFYNNFRCL